MKISVIGAGNLGCILATKFSQNHDVILYKKDLEKSQYVYKKDMKVINKDTNTETFAKIKEITSSLQYAIENSNYIFITYPAFLFEELSKNITKYLTKEHHLIFIPGSGGAELWFKEATLKGCTITGLQRVHSVARIVEHGSITNEIGVRKELKIASIPNSYNKKIKPIIEKLFSIPVKLLDNYLNITLINSNPILHTGRLYSIFKDYSKGITYNKLPLFYENWDDESSKLLISLDLELQNLFKILNKYSFDMSGITPILEHYESTNYKELTNKITSINSLKGLTTPAVSTDKGFIPDLNSRYFTADFPFGLDILLAFAKTINTDCKNMKKVSDWYHDLTNTKASFTLKDFNINNIEDIISFYKK